MTSEDTLRGALASYFDDYAIRERVRIGERNTVYDVTVDGRRAACKLTDCQPATLAREGAVQQAVDERTPVPVPEPVDSGAGHLVLEWVDGEPFRATSTGELRRARIRAVGRTLAQLHNATSGWFEGHGTLQRSDGSLTVDQPADWSTRFSEFVDEWAGELTKTPDADVGLAVVDVVDASRDAFADCSPVLVHGEASPNHVLFDSEDVAALIDWELSQAAPGPFDLVWAERDLLGRPVGVEDVGDLRRAVLDAYASERRLHPAFPVRRELYRASFAMRELTIVHDSDMPPQSDRGDYRELLRRYVFDRLDAAESLVSTSGFNEQQRTGSL